MTPRQHQIEGAEWALQTVRDYGLAYLAWQERTGKTLTALLAVENSLAKSCLIVTKKKAIPGWKDTLDQWAHKTQFVVINYESIHKIKRKFDFIILDESHHALSGVGKPSKTWKKVLAHTWKKPIIYLSATPYAEHLGLLYHQFKLSSWTPFKKHKNFYDWFRAYGIPHIVRVPYGLVEKYDTYSDEAILKEVDHLFNFKTRTQVGIEYEPSVNVVVIPLLDTTKQVIHQTLKDEVFTLGELEIPLDSPMKVRMVHYQLEGGTLKTDDGVLFTTSGREKINYIKDNYEQEDIAVMAHFIGERKLLCKELPKVVILSSDGDAEGVDLSRIQKLIVYSMSFKTSKHSQRLARQANHNRKTRIVVDVLVADKPGIGKAVYEAVAIKKENFDKNSYERALNEK